MKPCCVWRSWLERDLLFSRKDKSRTRARNGIHSSGTRRPRTPSAQRRTVSNAPSVEVCVAVMAGISAVVARSSRHARRPSLGGAPHLIATDMARHDGQDRVRSTPRSRLSLRHKSQPCWSFPKINSQCRIFPGGPAGVGTSHHRPTPKCHLITPTTPPLKSRSSLFRVVVAIATVLTAWNVGTAAICRRDVQLAPLGVPTSRPAGRPSQGLLGAVVVGARVFQHPASQACASNARYANRGHAYG